MKYKKWIPIALSLAIAGLLFSPALSMLGYGPDSVSGATSVPRSTTTAPATKAVAPAIKPATPALPAVQPAATITGNNYSNTPSTWAQDALQQASLAGLTFDSLMGQFNKPITRQEYAQLMVNLYEATTGKTVVPVTSKPFVDTYSIAVAKANALGLANGVGASRFDPNGTLTRQEAATMMYREWKLVHPDYQKPAVSYQFQDSSSIAPWAKDAIQFMVHEGLMQGTGNNRIDPTGIATREQAVVIALNNYEQSVGAPELPAVKVADATSKATQVSGKTAYTAVDATSKATASSSGFSLWSSDDEDDDGHEEDWSHEEDEDEDEDDDDEKDED